MQYRLGLAIYLDGQVEEALTHLRNAVALEPENESFLTALILLLQKLEQTEEATNLAKRLIELAPDNPQYVEILRSLEQG
ncbi:MAG: tetratricopeptide repeat protein [Pirellulaceae bacterium]